MADTAGGSRVESAVDGWVRRAFGVTTERSGVHRVGLALPEGGGRRLHFTASDRDHEHAVDWCHIDAYDDVPLNTAVRRAASVTGSLGDLDRRYAAFAERQEDTPTEAVAALPMTAAGQVVGALILFYDSVDAFAAEDRSELTTMADQLGSELRRARRHDDPVAAEDDLPPTARSAVHRVPPDLAAVGAARRFLHRTLTDWGVDDDASDTAVLCLSELVTNAVVHTHGAGVVQVVLDRGVLTTRVRDSGAGLGPGVRHEDPLQVHGRGLQLVDALASRWGSELDARGMTAWFVLDLDQ